MTFEEKVRAFFKKHKPGLAYLAPKIAKKFYHDQSAVLEHLHNRFVKGAPSTYDPNKVVQPKAAEPAIELGKAEDESAENADEAGEGAAAEFSEHVEGELDGVADEAAEGGDATEASEDGGDNEISLDKAEDEAPAEVEATEEEDKN